MVKSITDNLNYCSNLHRNYFRSTCLLKWQKPKPGNSNYFMHDNMTYFPTSSHILASLQCYANIDTTQNTTQSCIYSFVHIFKSYITISHRIDCMILIKLLSGLVTMTVYLKVNSLNIRNIARVWQFGNSFPLTAFSDKYVCTYVHRY